MSTDWLNIISAHVAWKQRLEELLRGTSTERLEPDVIALDNRCDLGKWIYGSGTSFSAAPDYGGQRPACAVSSRRRVRR